MAGKSKLPDPPKWGPSLAQFAIAVGAAVIIMNKKSMTTAVAPAPGVRELVVIS